MGIVSSFIPRDDFLWIIFLQLEILKGLAGAGELHAVQLKTSMA